MILHGGEPLLAGADHIRHAVDAVRSARPARVMVNAHRPDQRRAPRPRLPGLFDERGCSGQRQPGRRPGRPTTGTGVGPRAGRLDRVRAGLTELIAPRVPATCSTACSARSTCATTPSATYESLLAFAPPAMDFLLPHGNWETPPPGPPAGRRRHAVRRLAHRGLRPLVPRGPERETQVRLFDEIIRLLLGAPCRQRILGLSAVQPWSSSRPTAASSRWTASSRRTTEPPGHRCTSAVIAFDAALMLPSIAARQIGERALSPQCRSCEVRRVCGAGLYPHRYRPGTGFANPSVYCRDLFRLIKHIQHAVSDDVAAVRDRGRHSASRRERPIIAERHLHDMTLRPQFLPKEVFFDLAVGGGGGDAVERLWMGQDSKRLLLLRGVRDLAGEDAERVRHAFGLLAEIQDAAPEAAKAVLRYPTMGSWGLGTLHALSGQAAGGALDEPDGMAAVAAAAAIRSGRDETIEVPGGGRRDGAAVRRQSVPICEADAFAVVRPEMAWPKSAPAGHRTVDPIPAAPVGSPAATPCHHRGVDVEFVVDDLDPTGCRERSGQTAA